MKKFLTSESGAVTVDWVVLTAGLVGMGLAIAAAVGPAILNTANFIGETVCEAEPGRNHGDATEANGVYSDATCT